MKILKIFILAYSLIVTTLAAPLKNTGVSKAKRKFNIRELALPSEVEGLSKVSGSIFYNPSVKGKALVPVHFWGEVQKSGLHFVPVDTNLLSGISFAGGPKSYALLEDVIVTTLRSGDRQRFEFNIKEGGFKDSAEFILQPGDTVFIKRDNYLEDRAYYTGLIGVFVTVLSGILLYRQVNKSP
jgi:hypothetical protein